MKKQAKLNQYDKMTKTPVSRLVLGLSVPAIISMLITNIYNLVDTAFVGRLGTSASGAVGIVFGFMTVIQAVGFLFGQGAGSILSRALGQKDTDRASVHATAGFLSSFTAGLLVGIIGLIFLGDIVMLLGSTETIAPYAETYISYILIAAPFMCSCLTLNNMLRYEGKASLGMIGLMVGAVLNMGGDPILMFGLDMGIAGAGLSTALSQFISWAVLLSMFLCGKTQSKISRRYAKQIRPAVIADIAATGFPSMLRQGLNSLSTVLLNAQCAVYGDAAVAAEADTLDEYVYAIHAVITLCDFSNFFCGNLCCVSSTFLGTAETVCASGRSCEDFALLVGYANDSVVESSLNVYFTGLDNAFALFAFSFWCFRLHLRSCIDCCIFCHINSFD